MFSNLRPDFFKALLRSSVLQGALIFLLVDLIFGAGFWLTQDGSLRLAYDVPYRSHIWWATKEFLDQSKASDVVLLGASDMATAAAGADATYLNTSVDDLLHHRCEYLESKLRQLDSQYKRVFSLAVGGAMPSDSYFTAQTLLSGEHKPKVIVCSLTPRSFCDAAFGNPKSTDVYKVMSKLSGTQDFGLPGLCSLWDRFDYGLGSVLSIYGHKYELASWQHHLLYPLLSSLLREDFSKVHAPTFDKLAVLKLSQDHGPSEFISPPFDPKHPVFVNNMAIFQMHYARVNQRMFREQLDFLRELGEFCKLEGIRLVVVNSPRTKENRQLVKPEFHNAYLTQVSLVACKSGATFVDLDLSDVFNHDDFSDTVHLNGRGGQKYFDQIALILSRGSEVATSVHSRE